MPKVALRAPFVPEPTVLGLNGYWRNYGGSSPWPGTASYGASASNAMTAGSAPVAGTPLNGHPTSLWNATSRTLVGTGTLDTYVAPKAVSGFAIARATTNVFRYLAGELATTGLVLYKNDVGGGITRLFFQLNSGAATCQRAIVVGNYFLATWRYDGIRAAVGINEFPGASGGASVQAFTADILGLSGLFRMGIASALTWDGEIAEFGIADQVFSDETFEAVRRYANNRYALSL